jgi:hypothetical protein
VPQVIDPLFVATLNARSYAALQAPRRNSGNTAYEFATGVWADQNYSNPAWITSLANAKVTGLGSAALASTSDFDAAGAAAAVTLTTLAGGTAPTGSGAVVRAASPTLVTPALGTPASGVLTNCTGTASGLTAGAATALATARTINGVSFDGSANVTVASAAGTLTGTTLAANVVVSSLTSVGTLASGVWQGTAVGVAYGGTGLASATAYAVLCGGTTSTGAHQSIAGVGTSGQVLTSNGAGTLPTFQTSATSSGADPTASVGLTAVNGSATTFLRSDGAPALSQSIAPTWTGAHTFNTSAATFGVGVIAPKVYPASNSTTALRLLKADGTTSVVTLDTTNARVGVNCTPAAVLDVLGGDRGSGLRVVTTANTNACLDLVCTNFGGHTYQIMSTPSGAGVGGGCLAVYDDSAGSYRFVLNSSGLLGLNKSTSIGAQLHVASSAAGTVGAIVQGAASQTADLQQWQSSSGTAVATLNLGNAASSPSLSLSGTWFSGGTSTTTKPQLLIEPAGTTSTAWSTSGTGIGVNAASGFAGNLLDLQVAGVGKAAVESLGRIYSNPGGFSSFTQASLDATLLIGTRAAGAKGVIIRGITSQSGNLQEWQQPDGTGFAAVSPTQLLGPNGSVIAGNGPGICFNSYTSTGLGAGGGNVALWESGVIRLNLSSGEFRVPSDHAFAFSGATNNNSSADTKFSRASAGVVQLGSGGTYHSLKLGGATASTVALTVLGAASRTAPLLQLQTSAGASLGTVGGTVFNDFTDTSTTSTDGTENDLYSYTTVANTFAINGDSLHQVEHVQFVASATAARRFKKYFAGTLIWDSGALTLTLGGDFWVETTVIRQTSTSVRVSVNVVTTSASSVPYTTFTAITGLTLTGTNVLKTTGIASGTGAASGDITNKMSKVFLRPAA